MCLTLTNSPLDFVEGKRTCYKVVEKNTETGEYRSFFKAIPHEKEGWIESDRKVKELSYDEQYYYRVSHGIHVLNDMDAVSTFLSVGFYTEFGWTTAVLEVECYEEGLVATGEFKATTLIGMSSSVWMKVLIKGEIDLKEVTP